MRWYNLFLATSLIALAACSSTKQLQTQATDEVIQRRSGQLDDVLRSSGLNETWVVPVERNGVMVYDTIRHRIDMNDTVHHIVNVSDTIHSQVLAEQTKAKVPQKQKGLRESIYSVGNTPRGASVALIISIGINTILILVILSVFFLKSSRKI